MKREEAKYPYNNYYIYKVYHNKEKRNYAILIPKDKNMKRKTIAYSRYLMSVKLKRFLLNSEEVDHIDDNKTNDIIENLQILTKTENLNKQKDKSTRKYVKLKCPNCGKVFELPKNQSYLQKTNCTYNCCSRNCKDAMMRKTNNNKNKELVSSILKTIFIKEFNKFLFNENLNYLHNEYDWENSPEFSYMDIDENSNYSKYK